MRRTLPALALGLLAACGGSVPEASAIVPDLTLTDMDGIEAALAARRGKGLLVNHWATW